MVGGGERHVRLDFEPFQLDQLQKRCFAEPSVGLQWMQASADGYTGAKPLEGFDGGWSR